MVKTKQLIYAKKLSKSGESLGDWAATKVIIIIIVRVLGESFSILYLGNIRRML